jgi:hypothetical protein
MGSSVFVRWPSCRYRKLDPNILMMQFSEERHRGDLGLTTGLDPGLGIAHADSQSRDSLACDLMEPVRPNVDAFMELRQDGIRLSIKLPIGSADKLPGRGSTHLTLTRWIPNTGHRAFPPVIIRRAFARLDRATPKSPMKTRNGENLAKWLHILVSQLFSAGLPIHEARHTRHFAHVMRRFSAARTRERREADFNCQSPAFEQRPSAH